MAQVRWIFGDHGRTCSTCGAEANYQETTPHFDVTGLLVSEDLGPAYCTAHTPWGKAYADDTDCRGCGPDHCGWPTCKVAPYTISATVTVIPLDLAPYEVDVQPGKLPEPPSLYGPDRGE